MTFRIGRLEIAKVLTYRGLQGGMQIVFERRPVALMDPDGFEAASLITCELILGEDELPREQTIT